MTQAFFVAVFDDANQTARAVVDLVDEGHVVVAFGVGDFVDADGGDEVEAAVGETVLDDPLNAAKDAVPFGVKHPGAVFPTEQAGPLGEEDAKVVGEAVFAAGPGHGFGDDAFAVAAIDAAHGVVEAHGDVPEGDVVEGARLFLGVEGGTGLAAAGAAGAAVFAGLDGDFDELGGRGGQQGAPLDDFDRAVKKSLDRGQQAE